MSTAFIVLAAGRGSRMGRVGDALHKCLVPLGKEAVLSRLLRLRPPNARIIITSGYRADQVRRYVEYAHPSLRDRVMFAHVDDYDAPGAGPGASLLCALEHVNDGEDVVFTSCDTLWNVDASLWENGDSWVGVAPIPAGSPPERWCRIDVDESGMVRCILDKQLGYASHAYVGLTRIVARDVAMFKSTLACGNLVAGEMQVSAGLHGVKDLRVRRIAWTDVGDEAAYREIVRRDVGYDWTKPNQTTYVLEDEGRVVKFFSDPMTTGRRFERATQSKFFPSVEWDGCDMLAYDFIPGSSGYDGADARHDAVSVLMQECRMKLWKLPHLAEIPDPEARAHEFYHGKTFERIEQLRPELRTRAVASASRVDWGELCAGVIPSIWHGDLNLGNVVARPDGTFMGIDWREDFAGAINYGDRRYDLAKLYAGLVDVRWDRAQRGDFRRWEGGVDHARSLMQDPAWSGAIPVIAALTLINSAPLHEEPLDEVLVARGSARLEELL